MRFRTRLALVMSGLVLVLVMLTSGLIYRAVDRSLSRQVDEFLLARVATIGARLDEAPRRAFENPGRRFRNPLGDVLIDARFDVASQVISADGDIIFAIGDEDLPITKQDIAVATGDSPRFRDIVVGDEAMRMYVVPIQGGGALQVAREVGETAAVLDRVRLWLFGVGGALVVLAAAITWWLAALVTSPLRSLADAAENVATTGRLDLDIAEQGPREVSSLAGSFNRMLRAIRTSFDRERRFVQDASHELRTPLTSLRANSELLQRDGLNDDDRRAILSDMRAEIDELTAISAELSTLAVDQKQLETPMTVDLANVVEAVVERTRRRATQPIMFLPDDATRSLVNVRLSQFERALTNLLDNAVKFSPPDSTVEVAVAGRTVSVVDHGAGISDADKPLIFTRFFRAESTRSMPGSGLGLSIVKQFADDHAAEISVFDTAGGGATFVLTLAAD
ncbi:MAG: HAMP domain-containing protein [Actinobacteria bacterium]|nr:HAMP domain-containing protein [Actinomycetota bacterium]